MKGTSAPFSVIKDYFKCQQKGFYSKIHPSLSLLFSSSEHQDVILPLQHKSPSLKIVPSRNHCLLGSPSYWGCVPCAREVRRRQVSCSCGWGLQENLKSLENALVVEPRWPLLTSANGCQTKLGFARNAQVAKMLWMEKLNTVREDHRTGFSSFHVFSFSKRWEGERDPFNWKEQISNKDNCKSFSISKASLAPKIIIAVRTWLLLY